MIPVQKVFTKSDIKGIAKPLRVSLPLCMNCRFLKKGDCTKFMYVNLVDGKETIVPAMEARTNFEMCGIGGSHFRPKLEETSGINDE